MAGSRIANATGGAGEWGNRFAQAALGSPEKIGGTTHPWGRRRRPVSSNESEVSRKPKPDSHEESPAVASKTIALEYRPTPEEEHPGIEPAASDRSVESGSATPVAAKAPAAPAGNEERAALPSSQQPEEKPAAPTPTEATETLVTLAPSRQKKIKPSAEPVVVDIQADEEAPGVAAGPKSLIDEMADLDAEVDALRRQLAKKLIEQNAQLRKMLARFDAR